MLRPGAYLGPVPGRLLQAVVTLAYAHIATRAVYGQPWHRALAVAAGLVAVDFVLFFSSTIFASMAAMVKLMVTT